MEESVQSAISPASQGDTGSLFEKKETDPLSDNTEETTAGADSPTDTEACDGDFPEGSEAKGTVKDEEGAAVVDYARLAEEDLNTLKLEFSELSGAKSLLDLDNPLRYAQLRDLGLSAREAFLATRTPKRKGDNRQHLSKSVPGGASPMRGVMTDGELSSARDLFSGVSDSEIRRLYKRVTQ